MVQQGVSFKTQIDLPACILVCGLSDSASRSSTSNARRNCTDRGAPLKPSAISVSSQDTHCTCKLRNASLRKDWKRA